MNKAKELKAIVVPESLMPVRAPGGEDGEECACKKKPVDLRQEKGIIHWEAEPGDYLEKGDTIGEGEVGKRTVEIISPFDGRLVEQCIEELEVFEAETVLGYMEVQTTVI